MKQFALFFLTISMAFTAVAQTVSNVRFEQEDKKVKIYYDLTGEANIIIFISTDGGRTFEALPTKYLTGAVGDKVAGGKNRCALWDVLSDRDGIQGNDICFKVKAYRTGEDKTFTVGDVSFTMVFVEGGKFTMGCTSEQKQDGLDNEKPTHSVTLADYYIGETEVTQDLWNAVMASNPSYWKGGNLPVENVTYNEVKTFISSLNRLTGYTFRLPTEAEWEYAARGGKKSNGYKFSGSNSIELVAWYFGNSGNKTHAVKGKRANELGIYDMSGNVAEWCNDWYCEYSRSSQTNPKGPSSGSNRLMRGGSWLDNARHCRVSRRDLYGPSTCDINQGFRLALTLQN